MHFRSRWDHLGEEDLCIYTTMCKIDSWWEAALQHSELSSVLCEDLEGWDGGMGGDVCKYRADSFAVQQKPTQRWKASISK